MQISIKLRREFIIVALVIVIAIGFFIALGQIDRSAGALQASPAMEVQSALKMTETNLAVQLSGEIKEVHIAEGDTVKKGQLLAVLDDAALQIKKAQAEAGIETIQGQILGARANLAGAEAQLAKVQEGAREEELLQFKSKYDLAENLYLKNKLLYDQGVISQVEYDSIVSDRDVKKAQYELAVNGATANERKAAQASLNSAAASIKSLEGQLKNAESALSEIELQLKKTEIVAPTDGVLTQWLPKEGELFSAGSKIATIADDSRPWIECSIKETDLSKVEVGQEVDIRFGAYEGKHYTGKVTFINKNADFATKRATNESGSFDIKAYGIRVEVSQTDLPLYAGMTAFVTFQK